ncbi:MAG: hypothetical protein HOQ35_03010 [Acidobacteriaceae bacterium]|nr:hypothetical protein [Acidobacteriaceae bacterium]
MTAENDCYSPQLTFAGILGAAGWASILGVVSGLACVLVRLLMRGLQWLLTQHAGSLPAAAAALPSGRRLVTPILGALLATAITWFVKRRLRMAPFHEYVEAVRFSDGEIPFPSTFWRTLSSAFSVATGAAIGREGSMIQFAAAAASWVGKRSGVRLSSLGRQVSYGTAAAIAAAYSAPIAGVLFAFEVVLAEWSWEDAVPLAVSSVSGWFVSRALLGGGPIFAVHSHLTLDLQVVWGVLLAIALGCLAPLYHRFFRGLCFLCRRPFAMAWAGLVVGLLSLMTPLVWGNGDMALVQVLSGSGLVGASITLLLARTIATGVCVGAGTAGGVFTPTLFTGAALGLIAGQMFGVTQPSLFAVIGLAAFLAAVTHAPFMATMMAIELTGQWHLLPLLLLYNLLACEIARRLSSRSLYAIATPDPLDPEGVAA